MGPDLLFHVDKQLATSCNIVHKNLFIRQFIIRRFWIYDGLKVDPKSVLFKQKLYRLYRKLTIYGGPQKFCIQTKL